MRRIACLLVFSVRFLACVSTMSTTTTVTHPDGTVIECTTTTVSR